jgi:hypothetical protein
MSVALSEVTVPLTIEVHDGATVLSKSFSLQVEPKPANWLHAYQWKPLIFDVNVDGDITPIDALLVINELNATGPRALPKPPPGTISPLFFDVSGDDALGPLDALLVINFLNAGSAGQGEAAATDQAFQEDFSPAETSAATGGLTDSELAALWDLLETRKK